MGDGERVGLTRLSVRLIEQGIRLCCGRVSHPQTQGKVERLHRTLGIDQERGAVVAAEQAPNPDPNGNSQV